MKNKIILLIALLVLMYMFSCVFTPFNKKLRTRSIKNQINYLANLLEEGHDDELQMKYPEGKLFSNCLLALSIIEFCEKTRITEESYARIVDQCIIRIRSERALSNFDSEMIPSYGMFYRGWSNYLYSTYMQSNLIQFSELSNEIQRELVEAETEFSRIQSKGATILDSYPNAYWPADNLVGIASIKDDSLKSVWIQKVLTTTRHVSDLIHHAGGQETIVRGSSSAMIIYFLNKSDYPNLDNLYKAYDSLFVDNYSGIELVKENEDGSSQVDIDSGPILFGYGASATIMNIKTKASLHQRNAKTTWAAMNLLSLPINLFGKKFLLFKKEPMLDLFMLWSCVEL